MIAIITSTLIPSDAYSFYSPEERLSQTLNTIEKLLATGFVEIFIFDNSMHGINKEALVKAYKSIKIFNSPQYSFTNKGLSEALLLLNNIHHLPNDVHLFKISGRYYPNEDFKLIDDKLLSDYGFIGTGVDFDKKTRAFNTRAYFVKNKAILETTLILAIEEMLSYSRGIHGLKSFIKSAVSLFKPSIGNEYQLSLEQAFARVLKHNKNYLLLKKINVNGCVAGSDFQEFTID